MKTPVGPRVRLALTVNGAAVDVDVETGELLLDVLRERLGLTGAKRSCDSQVCGAAPGPRAGGRVGASPRRGGEPRGRDVQTIVGLARAGRLHPVQDAFLEASAFQCGFCTPGMILSVAALLAEHPDASPQAAKAWLRGNICRCTGYVSILEAVRVAQRRLRETSPSGP